MPLQYLPTQYIIRMAAEKLSGIRTTISMLRSKSLMFDNQFIETSRLKSLVVSCFAASMLFGCGEDRSKQNAWLESVQIANEKLKARDYLAAEEFYLKAKEQCESNFGKTDARTGTCLGYLAELYRAEQEYAKAAVTYKALIVIQQQCAPHSTELEQTIKAYKQVLSKVKEYGLEHALDSPGTAQAGDAAKGNRP